MAIFPVCWRWRNAGPVERIALAGLIVLPLVAASLALATQFAIGAAILWWPLVLAARDGAATSCGANGSDARPGPLPDNVSLPEGNRLILS
jgi:hypothetical protein